MRPPCSDTAAGSGGGPGLLRGAVGTLVSRGRARAQPRCKRLSGGICREPALRPAVFRSLLVRLLGAQHVPASCGRCGSQTSRCRAAFPSPFTPEKWPIPPHVPRFRRAAAEPLKKARLQSSRPAVLRPSFEACCRGRDHSAGKRALGASLNDPAWAALLVVTSHARSLCGCSALRGATHGWCRRESSTRRRQSRMNTAIPHGQNLRYCHQHENTPF